MQSDYASVTETLAKEGKWELVAALKDLSPEERVRCILTTVFNACTLPEGQLPEEETIDAADKRATWLIGHLFRATLDIYILEHTDIRGNRRMFKERTQTERERALQQADACQADLACQIHDRLPATIDIRDHDYRNTSGKQTKQCFLATRRTLLAVIAGRWSRTTDEDETKRLFEYIIKIGEMSEKGRHSEYTKILIDALRASNTSCQLTKLEQAIVSLNPRKQNAHQDILDVLGIAWVKRVGSVPWHSDAAPVQRLAALHLALGDVPSAFWAALMSEVKVIKELAANTTDLLGKLDSSWKIETVDHNAKTLTLGITVDSVEYQWTPQRAKEVLFGVAKKIGDRNRGRFLAIKLFIRKKDHQGGYDFEETFEVE